MYEAEVDGIGVISSSRSENVLSSMMAFPFVVGEQQWRYSAAFSRFQVTDPRLIARSWSRLLSQHGFPRATSEL